MHAPGGPVRVMRLHAQIKAHINTCCNNSGDVGCIGGEGRPQRQRPVYNNVISNENVYIGCMQGFTCWYFLVCNFDRASSERLIISVAFQLPLKSRSALKCCPKQIRQCSYVKVIIRLLFPLQESISLEQSAVTAKHYRIQGQKHSQIYSHRFS